MEILKLFLSLCKPQLEPKKIKYWIVLYVLPVFDKQGNFALQWSQDCKFSTKWSSMQKLSWGSREGDHQHSNMQSWTDKLSHLVTEQRELVTTTLHISYDKANLESIKQTRTSFKSRKSCPGKNAAMIKVITRTPGELVLRSVFKNKSSENTASCEKLLCWYNMVQTAISCNSRASFCSLLVLYIATLNQSL